MVHTLRICAECLVATSPRAQIFADRLRQRAGDYFASCEDARDVRYQGGRQHINCVIHRFDITIAGELKRVLIKVPFDRRAIRSEDEVSRRGIGRPRLTPKPDLATKAWFEFTTMSRIQRHFALLAEPRFAHVTVFDYWASERALVMEEVQEPLLANLIGVRARFWRDHTQETQLAAMHNAGAWLREFHTLAPMPHTENRCQSRDEFLEPMDRCGDYLANERSRPSRVFELIRRIRTATETSLPSVMPLALAHGDYGPRNVFVGPAGRVRGFDTIGRWRAPIYEDLARFLVELNAGASLGREEHEFLAGYFGDAVRTGDRALLRLFEIRALLGRWAAALYAADAARGVRQIAKRFRAAVQIPRLRRRWETLLRECEDNSCSR